MIPLDKLLQREGFGSRRDCRRLVNAGFVAVDGVACDDPDASFASDGVAVRVDGVDWVCREHAVLMLNKPTGFECSRSPTHHPSVLSLLPPQLARRGVQPVGRLDADTAGLLILTDDGALNHRLTSPKHGVPKRYAVTLKHDADAELPVRLSAGLVLRDSPEAVSADEVVVESPRRLLLTIQEGRYHQVKRMIAAAGNRVEGLERLAVGGLALPDDLPVGDWRWLTGEELARLAKASPATA